jgi:hypothetical protein
MDKQPPHSWKGVPLEKLEQWTAIFNASQEGVNLAAPCPVCGSPTLHRYYQVGRPTNRIIAGQRFVAEGASWEWCSTCRSYEHGRSLVPEWWSADIVVVSGKLTAEPEELQKAVQSQTDQIKR